MPNSENSTPMIPTPESVLRESLIEKATAGWTSRLIDLSRRNNLLFYKPLQSGTLELPMTDELLAFAIGGEKVKLIDLLAGKKEKISAIQAIARKGQENLEEKGVSTLYLTLGRCTWKAEDGGRDPMAPILLVPVEVKLKSQDLPATELRVSGPIEVNPVLLHLFNREWNIQITADILLELLGGKGQAEDDEARLSLKLDAVLESLNTLARGLPSFRAEGFAVVSNFSFQKLAMVRDLEKRQTELIASEVVAAIAGDDSARLRLGKSQVEIDPNGLDFVPPDNEFAVLEADSSQQCAIDGISAGQSAVVHGPPGTGKSQTITNLIATLAARGKKVLFVAEKRAALEVVMDRLTKVGLDHLVIDLHGAEQTPKKVMERVARTLTMVREQGKPSDELLHEQFVERRNKLNQHVTKMHTVCLPAEMTLFEIQGALLRLPVTIMSTLRWRGSYLSQITKKESGRIRDLLGEATGFESLFTRTDPSPWNGVELNDGNAAQGALDLVGRFDEVFRSLVASLSLTCEASRMTHPETFAQVGPMVALLRQAERLLAKFSSEIFSEADGLLKSLQPGQSAGLSGFWNRLTNGSYKGGRKRAIALRNGIGAPPSTLYAEVTEARQCGTNWSQMSGPADKPHIIRQTRELEAAYVEASDLIHRLGGVLRSNLDHLRLDELQARLSALNEDSNTPYRISRLSEIERELRDLGVQRLVDEIRTSRRPAKQWGQLFDYVWLQSTLDAAAVQNPDVRGFVGKTHCKYVEDFGRLDRNRLELAAQRVRRAHAERVIQAMNQFPEQETLIRVEASRLRKHKPLRKTFQEAEDVLTAVCPCWMASPLSVCQLIANTGVFDYVIFDEASQVLPEEAVPAILRGGHVIVAGDNKQLPPTTFFSAAEDDDEDDSDATTYESLLDMMIPFVKGFHLNWHYRSRDESLITFSNHHIYDDRLVTFPGPGIGSAVSHVVVDQTVGVDGQEVSSGEEVRRVVSLVLEHARSTPDRTLGVITMGVKHALRIQAQLDKELPQYPELFDFFDPERKDRFFIKNLERVQGDERDQIILSIGYGKDRAGNLPLRFGPILSAAGRRRLNVAVTRAKQAVTVVSSFTANDIDSTRVRPGTGLEFLKNYLQFASSGGALMSRGAFTEEPMNDFELDVLEVLTARGIKLVPQVGCSKFRIDFAACHPTSPGRYVLAIECDGATYHSSYTARDRDRLRQQQLESLGWTFHRIWSTDWYMRRHEEVERAFDAYQEAVEASDRPASTRDEPGKSARVEPPPIPSAPQPTVRNPARPPIPVRDSIGDYPEAELRALLRWVKSDGKLRSNDELEDEMFEALPFARRGSAIKKALQRAIARG